jgi:iron complex outermembrane receptor protein
LTLFPPGAAFPTGAFPNGVIAAPETWERQLRVSAFVTYAGFVNHSVRFGLGHDDLDLYRTHLLSNYDYAPSGLPVPIGSVIDNTNLAPFLRPHRRQIDYLYAQDEWAFTRDWTLTSGIRHDRYSDFGGTTNPRLALVWDATQEVTAKLLYGRAFRAPCFNEQYGINPVASGNANIGPETIKTTEAAVSWKVNKDTQVNLSLFRYAMQDLITLVPNPAPAPGATDFNTGRVNGQGLELELVHDFDRNLRVSGNYSQQRSIDEATNQDAGYAPHQHLYARADWQWAGGCFFSSQINHVADRRRATGDTRPQIPDYTTVDFTLRSNLVAKRWEVALSVRNLFNTGARDPSLAAAAVPGRPDIPTSQIPNDLPLAGRSAYVQVMRRW